MQLFEVAALTAAAVNSTLASFVLWQNWRSPLHRAYFLWGVGVALWNISAFFLYQPIDKSVALLWAKLLQFGIIIAPVGLYETARLISGRGRRGILVFSLYGLHGFFILSLATGWFISDVRWITFGYWSIPGPLFWAYVVSYLILTSGAQLHLFRAQRSGNRSERIRIRALLVAIVCIWIAGTNDLLPILGIDNYRPFLNVNFYPLGSVAACIYMTIVAYSVLQHTLLDVHVVLGRVSAHVVRIGFLTLTGMCLLLLAAGITGEFTGTTFFSALSVVGLSALTASIFFPRLFGDGPQSFEQRILGDRFEYQDKVRSFNLQMSWYVDLDTLLDDLHTLLTKTFRIEKYSILLSDESNQQLSPARRYPDEGGEPPTLKATSSVFQYFEWGKGEYLSLNSMYLRLGASPVERSAREQMIGFDADFCFPLAWQHEPFGLLLVGAKTAGEPYSATDINLLIALAKNLSMVVNQIRLKTQILHVQELDLLGRMSRGMAHDLNNLLTPVSTLLQLATESGSCDAELLPTALRNISTMQAYIRESLFFSEHPHPELSMDRLDLVIHQTVQLTRGTRKKEVEIIADTPGEVVAEMNGVLIQRLLINLISNAVDASAPGTTVRVRLATFKSGLAKDEWVRVQVIDQGEGISRENMNRVQRPYFTTKDRGDENRGFGLGLAICRKIVTLHGGHLEIESELERGTTVQVDLPRYRIPSIGTERPSLISFSASA